MSEQPKMPKLRISPEEMERLNETLRPVVLYANRAAREFRRVAEQLSFPPLVNREKLATIRLFRSERTDRP